MSDWMQFFAITLGIVAFVVCFVAWLSHKDTGRFYEEMPKLPPIPYADHKFPPPTPTPGCTCGCNDPENQPDKVQQILREELRRDDQDDSEGDGEVRH